MAEIITPFSSVLVRTNFFNILPIVKDMNLGLIIESRDQNITLYNHKSFLHFMVLKSHSNYQPNIVAQAIISDETTMLLT
jgi:hypothetical protein